MSRHHTRLHARRWMRVRRTVLDRDGWRCRRCGRAGRMEVDHVIPLDRGGDPWDAGNLQTLCRPCHVEKTLDDRGIRLDPERERWRKLVKDMVQDL